MTHDSGWVSPKGTVPCRIFAAWLWLLPAIASAADPAGCELVLAGKPVEKLVLSNEQGRRTEIVRPGARVRLPPGRYRIAEISVRWDQGGPPETETDVNWLTLTPAGARRLNVGASETPQVTATRWGRLLKLSYDARSGGYASRESARATPPQFVVYEGDRQVASGSFEYG